MSLAQRPTHGRVSTALLGLAAVISCALLASAVFASGATAAQGPEFHILEASPAPLTSETVDPATNIIYAQANDGTSFYSYDPRTNVWTELADAPETSGNNGGAAYVNGKIYTAYTENTSSLGVYDIATNTWSTIANPLEEGTADITATGEELYMAVGTKFIKYDPATETTTPLAEAPDFPTCGPEGDTEPPGFEPWGGLQPYEGKLYGHQGNGCTGFGAYDIASNTWTELPSLPGGAVAGSAIDPENGAYYAYGNYGGESFYRYNIAAGVWSTVTFPSGPVGDGGMAYVSLPGVSGVYVIQGEDGSNFTRYIPVFEADLALTQSASASSSTVGEELTYTIKVADNGPDEAMGTTVTDALPTQVTFVSAATTQGSCSSGATVSCSLGSLANGASATVTVKVKANATGTVTNTADVSGETYDPNSVNNSATVSSTIAAAPVVSAQPALLPARWQVPNGILRVGRGVKWVSDPLVNLNSTLSLTGTAELVSYVAPGGHGTATVLAKNSVYLAAGATRTLYLRLSATALSRLRTGHRSVVQIVLALTDPFGRTVKATGVYYLIGAKPQHHKK